MVDEGVERHLPQLLQEGLLVLFQGLDQTLTILHQEVVSSEDNLVALSDTRRWLILILYGLKLRDLRFGYAALRSFQLLLLP